jgi:uncharacterized RDD family membrane protein YckC
LRKPETVDPLKEYINTIEKYLPFSKRQRKQAMSLLTLDIEEAVHDTPSKKPNEIFGDPYDVAKKFAQSYEWNTIQAKFKVRALAYIIDLLLSLNLGFFWLMIITIYFWNIIIAYIDKVKLSNGLGSYSFLDPDILILEIALVFIVSLAWIITFGHSIIFEKKFSTTLGKRVCNIIVCDQTRTRITWGQGLNRNLTKFIPGLLLGEILLTPFLSTAPNQRIFDKIGGMIILQEKSVPYKQLVIKCSIVCLLLVITSLIVMELVESVIIHVVLK